MKYRFFLPAVLLLFSSNKTSAQSLDRKNLTILEHNIISYHIRNAVPADLPVGKNDVLFPNGKPLFQQLMPINGKLRIVIEPYKGNIKYPDADYQIFTILLPGFKYDLADSTSYSVHLLGFPFDENYLVAYNHKNCSIKYISGNFFKSRVAEDFNLNPENIASFNDYLMLRCYNMLPDSISYNRKDATGIYFKLRSKVVECDMEVFISYDDYEVVKQIGKIKQKNKNPL
ncbi:hypothetical protein SAMN04488128_108124 [Chitinophaga eiseniae]|uniref:DUF4138 domain-containing protein n=1 Tax=Chitinophaga eiseniae TaxID=634771 RepID=A0A1T4U3I7_9BACT|nr:hypothetical protein [Chitinophaga eiseniae]SKA47180.1 hypothetical protein SAMN04488128_108124 [Chitinophaga eiseniae]